MTNLKTHQREEESSRQHGYGEGVDTDGELKNQSTPTAGYKAGSPVAKQRDHGEDIITDMDDPRVPNMPNDGTDDDSSARLEGQGVHVQMPDSHALEDAYEKNDPGVKTKK
tara:strand:- start:185 stop:517 length:333 start_codon:yes stop_codon:yes gene_type:complete